MDESRERFYLIIGVSVLAVNFCLALLLAIYEPWEWQREGNSPQALFGYPQIELPLVYFAHQMLIWTPIMVFIGFFALHLARKEKIKRSRY